MKRLKLVIVALIAVAFGMAAQQGVEQLPVTEVGGRLMHYYEVQPKETLYSLSHKLGVGQEYIEQHNPSVRDGLRAFMTLYFPAAECAEGRTITHIVEKKETIYGLSKLLGVSPEMLIEQNPQIADGLRAGQTITVTLPGTGPAAQGAGAETAPKTAPAPAKTGVHRVERGETFYSIAHNYGVTVTQLAAANPEVGVLKEGTELIIPEPKPAEPQKPAATADSSAKPESKPEPKAEPKPEPDIAQTPVEPVEKTETPEVKKADGSVSIAVMLPFMLGQKEPDKSALRHTEFYKGLLMAVDTLKSRENPTRLRVFDTANSSDSVRAALSRLENTDVQVIIAPDDQAQFELIAAWARPRGIEVFNTFLPRDDTYKYNGSVMQSNIPIEMLNDDVIGAMQRRYPDHTFVFLTRDGGNSDKSDFVDSFRSALASNGRKSVDITFSGKLGEADLAALTDQQIIFVPVSSRQDELKAILPALIAKKGTDSVNDNLMLFGYPEWTVFRGETAKQMHDLGTVIYSRFYADSDDLDFKRVNQSFEHWFDAGMAAGLPRQGALGFDVGCYLINALRHNGGDFSQPTPAYSGVQSGFEFERASDEGGWVNSVAYIVIYRPMGIVEKTEL